MAPGDGWGEYVEEYEAALCVSLDIDHGYRWDTRYQKIQSLARKYISKQ